MRQIISIILASVFLSLASCGNHGQPADNGKNAKTSVQTLNALNEKIASDAENGDLYELRAKYYLTEHILDKAITDINKAISINAKKVSYYITLSDIYLLMGKPQNCGDALKQANTIDPKNNEALIKLAKLNLILKEYKTCFDYVNKAIELEPSNPQAYFTRGVALLEKADTLKAVSDFKKAVDQDQKYYEAYLELGELYSIKKDKMAADYLKNALNVRPNDKVALYLLGMFYQESGQYDQAIQTYQTLIKADSTYRNAPYNIGYIYLVYLKDFPKSADFFSKALHVDPGYYEALFNRGYAYELSGQYDKATTDYQLALKIKPNYENAITGLNRLDKLRGKQ
jgi:tetratricopeptide (TPR) repeat protein